MKAKKYVLIRCVLLLFIAILIMIDITTLLGFLGNASLLTVVFLLPFYDLGLWYMLPNILMLMNIILPILVAVYFNFVSYVKKKEKTRRLEHLDSHVFEE